MRTPAQTAAMLVAGTLDRVGHGVEGVDEQLCGDVVVPGVLQQVGAADLEDDGD